MYTQITSRTNGVVKFAVALAQSSVLRQREGAFFAEGVKLCIDIAKTTAVKTLFFTEKALEQQPSLAGLASESYLVHPRVAEKLSTTQSTQGVFAIFQKPEYSADMLDPSKGVILCENLQDPGNVGAVLRTAAGLGYGGVALCGACADPFSPKSLRASSGGVGRITVVEKKDAAEFCVALKKEGVVLYASALDIGAVPLQKTSRPQRFALAIGNEGVGISRSVLDLADKIVYLPMQNEVESLNAAAAAAIFMYHYKAH